MSDWARQFTAIVERELRALARSRSVWLLCFGFFGLLVTIAVLGGTAGYVPLILALLTPVEVMVPVLAVALGYRAILGDRLRGELKVLDTFPITPLRYGLGVYCGRLAVIFCVVLVTLIVAVVFVPLSASSPNVLAQSGGLDSPVFYARFVALTLVFAAVMLAITLLVSAVARSARRGLVLAVGLLVMVVIGLDLVVVAGVGRGWITEHGLGVVLAASPVSAYRGLVLSLAVEPAVTMPVRAASPLASVVSLSTWAALSLFLASGLTGIE